MTRRLSPPFLAVALCGLVGLILSARGMASGAWPSAAGGQDPAVAAYLYQLAGRQPLEKVEDKLREVALAADPSRWEYVVILSAARLALEDRADFIHRFVWPAGEHVTIAHLPSSEILPIARQPGVVALSSGDPDSLSEPPDGRALPDRGPTDLAALRRRLATAPGWSAAQAAAGIKHRPARREFDAGWGVQGWYDVEANHAAREAWQMGYSGAGVVVGVLDYAVDFAHPDLQGTWQTLPEGHPYAGWPQAFDPVVGYQRALDGNRSPEQASTRTAQSGMIELYQRSAVSERLVGGRLVPTACFRPLLNRGSGRTRELGDERCDYVVPPSRSGEVRFGHHPDSWLAGLGARPAEGVQGEWTGVLITDPEVAGRYDTVFVDLDGDHDFTDEKPTTEEDPLSWRDVSLPPDGYADLSGGLLYFIADGEHAFPGLWLFGLDEVAPAGSVIGLLVANPGDHGTLCASNIVSQGRLPFPDDYWIGFRDLASGRPPAANLGLAPEARLVSIGSVYSVNIGFEAGWRYAVLGHDPNRADDDLQVTSNSYGFSGTDNDGWDSGSRLVDYYVRHFAPSTTFLFSTGNGAPGYGTLAPPSPELAIDVAASTQMGSTGGDSITETLQITFGDIIPFSNRGPGADGSIGPAVAANGAYAAGAEPVNLMTASGSSGKYAQGLWGGTSRSSPVAAGALALAYQAFRDRHARWPTAQEAKALLMAGARYSGYDPFAAGAGVVDAGDSVRIAAGRHGLYAAPSEWVPGDYRGAVYPAFAKLVQRGVAYRTSIELVNPSDEPIVTSLSAGSPRRIGSYETTLVTDIAAESPPGRVPDYLIPIDRQQVPAGTELMVVRGVFPMAEFDLTDPPYAALTQDNAFSLAVLQHTDVNGDGALWVDANGNGAVNHRTRTDALLTASWADEQRSIDALAGSVGQPLTAEGLSGHLAYYGLACNDSGGRPLPPSQPVAGKIALLERGSCTYRIQVENAQRAGAIGGVVYTGSTSRVTMGGSNEGITIPAVMIDRRSGLELRQVLEAGGQITVTLQRRSYVPHGLDGEFPVDYQASEIQEWEFNRFSQDSSARNNWQVAVHHPLERWRDGLYIAVWHVRQADPLPQSHLRFRIDFYAWGPDPRLAISPAQVTVPPRGSASFRATYAVPADAPTGAWQGAIFVDYDRDPGDRPVRTPGGYELPQKRLVIPVTAQTGARYDWLGSIRLGGDDDLDPDAPYPNGIVRGAFNWSWRAESGDWRFLFVDAEHPPADTYWLFRTTWQDEDTRQSDIDTRVYGPAADAFSNPDDPSNRTATPPFADPGWYGHHSMGLLVRSSYLVSGSRWPFDTTSGGNEDWLMAPARAGLHEVMLHNVLFSGSAIDMPFEHLVSSIRIRPSPLALYGTDCAGLEITSQVDLEGFRLRAFGLSVPERIERQPAAQDDAQNPASASFKHGVRLTTDAGRFTVTLTGDAQDNLDLFLLRDANADGQFTYPGEVVAQSTGARASERIALRGIAPQGAYQVWVLGTRVPNPGTTFDLVMDVIQGDRLTTTAPPRLEAGETVTLEVCADLAGMEEASGPAAGVLWFGPAGAPLLFEWPVAWQKTAPPPTATPRATATASPTMTAIPSPTPLPTETPLPATATPPPPPSLYLPSLRREG